MRGTMVESAVNDSSAAASMLSSAPASVAQMIQSNVTGIAHAFACVRTLGCEPRRGAARLEHSVRAHATAGPEAGIALRSAARQRSRNIDLVSAPGRNDGGERTDRQRD
jgi:hypothetical protein